MDYANYTMKNLNPSFEEIASMTKLLEYPFDIGVLMRKRRALRTELSRRTAAIDVRIALLGGSTTNELRDFLELFLLDTGIRPVFYESQYNKYEEDVLVDDGLLRSFAPQIAVVHTTWVNARLPDPLAPEVEVDARLSAELARFEAIWTKLIDDLGCTVIQNNFDIPLERSMGGLDASRRDGRASFLCHLNLEFARSSQRLPRLIINDIAHQSAVVGLDRWHEKRHWFSYKLAVSPAGTVTLAHSIAAIVRAVYGKTRKCLILDLDNTLWGGVIGDDGLAGLRLGNETPEAEAFTAIQLYCLELKRRGVLLAVCSKNDPKIAQEGFSHPDSILSLEDFSAFKAGWGQKDEAIVEISHELNIGFDSLVFFDDNPAERELVAMRLPMVAVPNIGSDPSNFVEILDRQLYFEPLDISAEDLKRASYYASNTQRNLVQASYGNYGEFLDSLEMKAEIRPFAPVYMDRIAQLTNKTNQFNLTTRRYTLGELEAMRCDPRYLTLYGRLADKFGDNGLVSIVVGRVESDELHIDLWLMSCRVLKRELEIAMLDKLVEQARKRNIKWIQGTYLPTPKNGLVADHYEKLGFELLNSNEQGSEWKLDVLAYTPKNTHISEDNNE
ncbi:MAG: HAD-IIIC family phosphatase [Methylococcales bacterium]|nr:HAD-IIIC family phosphatase [Methylococcales bacterium]